MKKFRILFAKELKYLLRDPKSILTSIVIALVMTPAIFGVLKVIQDMQAKQVETSDIVVGIDKKDEENRFIKLLDQREKLQVKVIDDEQDQLRKGEIMGYIEIAEVQGIEQIQYIVDERSNISVGSVSILQEEITKYTDIRRSETLSKYNISATEINPIVFTPNSIQRITGEVVQSGILLFFLPYLILLGLIQGSIQYAIEMTTGEKERNTLATTMLMNVSRFTIALSKISVTLIFSILMLIVNIISIVISFTLFPQGGDSSISLTPAMLLQLTVILLPLSFLSSAVMILLGIYARNQKEAGIYSTPLIFGGIFIGFAGNAFDVNTPMWIFAIPMLGHVASIKQILQGSFILGNNLLLIISTLILFFVVVSVTVNMFRREEVLFRQ